MRSHYNILLWSYKIPQYNKCENIQYDKTAQSFSQLTTKLLQAITLTAASELEGILSDWKIQACCIKDTSSSAIKALDNLHLSRAQ